MAIGIGAVRVRLSQALRWPQGLARWRKVSLDLLFPPRCACCDADLPDSEDVLLLCGHCQQDMAPQEWFGCPACGARMGPGVTRSGACYACRGMPFHFDRVVPLGSYDGLLREAVLKMKRAWGEPLSMVMGEYFIQRRRAQLASLRPDVVVPIPMHWWRRWKRKTNSPDLLADRLARFLRVPVLGRALRHCRNTKPHKDLPHNSDSRTSAGRTGLARGGACRGLACSLWTTS